MRFWIVSLSILHLSLTAQNAATQYANITITINGDATKSVTMAASQQTVYAAYNDSQAYILVPTVTKTLTGLEIESAGKIDLDFSIQVRPVQTAAETFQLQASTLIQRFNIVSFLSPFYYLAQFYPLQIGAGVANSLYAFATLSTDSKTVKLWYQGQTVIGASITPRQTTLFSVCNSYNNYNILESSTGTTDIKTIVYKMSFSKAAIDTLANQSAGTYFFQIYLTLNPYQVPVNSVTSVFLTNTLTYLNALYQQTFSYRAPAPAQVLTNRQFLLAEIQEVEAAIALL
jgi:hypothetical protein